MLGYSTTLVLEMARLALRLDCAWLYYNFSTGNDSFRVLTLTCIAALSFFSCPLSFCRSNLDLCLSHVRCRLTLLFHNFDGRSYRERESVCSIYQWRFTRRPFISPRKGPKSSFSTSLTVNPTTVHTKRGHAGAKLVLRVGSGRHDCCQCRCVTTFRGWWWGQPQRL